MAKKFTPKTKEEKDQQVQGLLDQLEEGILAAEINPDSYKAMLEMQALFYNYSFRNMMLIQSQMPNARYVAGFHRWKELGRNVIKGQKALYVLAPRILKEEDKKTGEEKSRIIGYLTRPVFDVSQTEGEDLPIDHVRLILKGESDEAEVIFAWVKALAELRGTRFEIAFANGANGYYQPSANLIVVDPKLGPNHRAKTAVHEYVHSLFHGIEDETKEEQECVAEGAAFVVCSYFGLDTSSYSFEYVKGWAQDDTQVIIKYGSMIQKAAYDIINEIESIALGLPLPEVVK